MNENRRQLILITMSVIIVLASIVGLVVLLSRETPSTTIEIQPPPPTSSPTITSTPSPVEVYVTGAVQNSELLVELPAGSNVNDAIQAAGGPLEIANLEAVNLAQNLQDGDMVHVPSIGETTNDTNGASGEIIATPTRNAPRIININTAAAELLDTLPNIGPARAADIIAYREENGPFTTVEDLLNISGIGEATLEELRPYITTE